MSAVEHGELHVVERKEPARETASTPEPQDWFGRGLELEASDPAAARAAYERAVDVDPANLAAWVNLGRLLHEQRKMSDAESVYQRALAACGPDALLISTSACCSRTCAGRPLRSRRISQRSSRIRASPIAITTWRGFTRPSVSRSTQSATSASTDAY